MRLAVLASAIAVFFIVIAMLYRWGARSDTMQRRFTQVTETERAYSDIELRKSFSERVFQPMAKRVSEGIRRVAGRGKTPGPSKSNIKLEKQLKSAGLSVTVQEFTFIKGILGLVFLIGGIALAMLLQIQQILRLLILLVMFAIPVYGTTIYLRTKVKSRKEEIVRTLPDVMDLLVVSVEAGLGMDAAIVRQYAKKKNAVLAELNGAIREVQMGVPRKVALKEMAERCDVKQLSTFVTALLQAEQLGVPIKNVLSTQAERLRIERKQMIQAQAAKAPVKIMLPTVVFIFPVIFIILLGPAVLNLISTFT